MRIVHLCLHRLPDGRRRTDGEEMRAREEVAAGEERPSGTWRGTKKGYDENAEEG